MRNTKKYKKKYTKKQIGGSTTYKINPCKDPNKLQKYKDFIEKDYKQKTKKINRFAQDLCNVYEIGASGKPSLLTRLFFKKTFKNIKEEYENKIKEESGLDKEKYFKYNINNQNIDIISKVKSYLLTNNNIDREKYRELIKTAPIDINWKNKLLNFDFINNNIIEVKTKLFKKFKKYYFKINNSINKMINGFWNSLPLNQIKNLIALSFTKYKLGERTFYLIGERHDTPNPCNLPNNSILISGLIQSVIDEFPNKEYDLFVELDVLRKDKLKNYNTIYGNSISFNLLRDIYGDCLRLDEEKEKCANNLRIHYVDYRNILNYEYNKNFNKVYNNLLNNKQIFDEYYAIIQEMINEPTIKNKTNKIIKQFENIEPPELRDKIYTFFYKKLNDMNSLKKIETLNMDLIDLVMDIYAATRIFRSFESKNKNNIVKQPYQSKNIIYYAGNDHIKVLKDLLVFLEADFKATNIENRNVSCIDFTKLIINNNTEPVNSAYDIFKD